MHFSRNSPPIRERLTKQLRKRLEASVECYLLRRFRRQEPVGSYNAGIWYPETPTELRSCCGLLRHPGSLKRHCRSIVHIANHYSIDPALVRGRLFEIRCGLADTLEEVDYFVCCVSLNRLRYEPPAPAVPRSWIETGLDEIRSFIRDANGAFSLCYPPIHGRLLYAAPPWFRYAFGRPGSIPGKLPFGGGGSGTEGIDELLQEIEKLTRGEA